MSFLLSPWPWYVAGPLIALVMFLLLFFGKSFGVSANLRTICSIGGGGRYSSFFNFNWKGQMWNLAFVVGAIIGGMITVNYLSPTTEILLHEQTILSLKKQGFTSPGESFLPPEIFGWDVALSVKGFLILISGGFLVGFGARYAGGCTSGHAISGLSNLQVPSLIAVVGFFIGGLITTHLLIPIIF